MDGVRGFDPHRFPAGRALFIRLRSLGDTVLMTPVLEAVHRIAGWRTAVVLEKPFDQILAGNPHADHVFALPRSLRARGALIRRLRSFRADIAIDLHGGTTGAWMTFVSGARWRVGYAQNRNSFLYNVQVPDSTSLWGKSEVHTVEHQLSPLKHLGFPVEPVPSPRVQVEPTALNQVRCRLAEDGIGIPFLLVHPAAAFDTKRWDCDKFASLLHQLSGNPLPIVMTAGPGQETLLDEIRSLCPSPIHVIEPLDLPHFTALASLCHTYLGNDTGPTHIAAALGKSVVVIFGSSDWRVWHPFNTRHRLLKADLPCIPCPGYTCGLYDEPRCIKSIEVSQVLQAVRSLL